MHSACEPATAPVMGIKAVRWDVRLPILPPFSSAVFSVLPSAFDGVFSQEIVKAVRVQIDQIGSRMLCISGVSRTQGIRV